MSRSVQALGGIHHLAVGNIDITNGFCIGEFSEGSNYQSVSGVEVLFPLFQLIDKL